MTGGNVSDTDPAPSQRAAAAAANDADPNAPKRTITLSTGVVLRLKPVSPETIGGAARHIPRPQVPRVMIPEKEREEENPDDPAYRAALQQWGIDSTSAGFRVALILGTEVVSVPDDLPGVDDDRWLDDLLEAAQTIGWDRQIDVSTPSARKLAWLENVAMGSEDDQFLLSRIVTESAMLTEGEVQRMLEAFRDRRRRGIDILARVTAGDDIDWGNGAPAAAGDGSAVRGAGGSAVQPDPVGQVPDPTD